MLAIALAVSGVLLFLVAPRLFIGVALGFLLWLLIKATGIA